MITKNDINQGAGNLGQIGGKLKVLVCHPTKKVSKAQELTYLSTSIDKGYFRTLRQYL
jgi:hypothetical protein